MRNCLGKGLILVGLGLVAGARTAEAQKPGPEFGVRFVGLSMVNPDGDDNNTTSVGLGRTDVSVAFYLGQMIAVEPTLTYGYTKAEGSDDASSSLGLQIAVPIYLKKGWGQAGGLFIAPHIGIDRNDAGAGDATGQSHVGVSVGTKLKISTQLWWRMQAGFDMALENEDDALPKTTTIGASFGLGVYLP